MGNIIAVGIPSRFGLTKLVVTSATYAEIPSLTNPSFVFVALDETNGNLPTVYFFDGSGLQWLPSVGV